MDLKGLISHSTSDALLDLGLRLPSLVAALGSPLFCLVPTEFADNVKQYFTVFESYRIRGRVWYAVKANKAESFLDVLPFYDAGADVATREELQAALGHGLRGDAIGVSGPDKSDHLLLTACLQNCTIAVDSITELYRLKHLHFRANLKRPCNIFIRLSGFDFSVSSLTADTIPTPDNSRFGIPITQWPDILRIVSDAPFRAALQVAGISFHIDNYSLADRTVAIHAMLDCGIEALKQGHPFAWIDIGGGIPCQYVSPGSWSDFTREYVNQSNAGHETAFRGRDLGIKMELGKITNKYIYPHDTELFKGAFLSALLESTLASSATVADRLKSHNIGLVIEPGRSLLDQAGFTVCQVKGVKSSSSGRQLLCVEMNISHMWDQMIGSEFTVDPILIPQSQPDHNTGSFKGHIVGNLCLENDIITWRQVSFSRIPKAGDLLVFPNTAGYQMDFIESRMHRMQLPQRVSLFKRDGHWSWKLDNNFSGLDLIQT